MSSAWQTGYKSYWEDGTVPTDNPFDEGTREWLDWADGWWEASDEDMEPDYDEEDYW